MRDIIIDTEAMINFNDAVDSTLEADKKLSGFILGYGQAGRGKTVTADRYHFTRDTGAYVRVWQGWSQTSFLQRLLFEVRGENDEEMPRHNGNRCKELVVNLLEKKPMPLFIDEADRLHIDRVEDLRDIHEMTGVPIVLVGEEALLTLLAERRRIWSRVVHEVKFDKINAAEVGIYALEAATLNIPATLCKRIADKAEGDFRLVRNMMILLEKAARATETDAVDTAMLEAVFKARNWRRK